MSEQKIIKNQLIKNMMFNLIAFTIIFSVFGLIIYGQFSNSLYKSADEELLNSKDRMNFLQNLSKDNPPSKTTKNDNKQIEPRTKTGMNPRLIYVLRDENGNITSNGNIGYIYTDEYIESIKFDKDNLNKIYKLSMDSIYQYRGINYKLEQDGKIIYVQVLINVDAEEDIINSFSRTLVICIIISIILSILASYILSRNTLKPIIKSWKKQTEFVQNASHELRTPLTIIQTKQELLLENPESKIIDKADDITISLNETRRLSKLVKDLMILARADSSEKILKKESFNLDEFVSKMCIPYKEIAEIEQKEFITNLEYDKDIKADQNRIHQLLVIVLDNAIKYTESKDKIEICTYEKENKCIIEIKDTGIGISDETKKHMFDRFYREDKARNRETGGTGLGLSIANFIVEAHGGNIKAEHNKPKGTIIIIKIPR